MNFLDHATIEQWLVRLCRQVDFPGVELRFESGRESAPSIAPMQGTIAWKSPIESSMGLIGELQVLLRDEAVRPHFLRACELADGLVQMARQYAGLVDTVYAMRAQGERSRNALGQASVQETVEASLKSLLKLTSYRGVAFFFLDPAGATLQLKHYLHRSLQPLPTSERQLLMADFDRQALLDGWAVCHRRHPRDASWLPEDVRTGLCVRVGNGEGLIGTLWAFDRRFRAVEDRDLHVVQSIAAQLGEVLDQAVVTLYSANHRRMKTELMLASSTQPSKTIEFVNESRSFSAYGLCRSQFDVGGDLCEVVELDDDHIFTVVGDASGNSIPAAMVMTAVRGAIYALLEEVRESNRETPRWIEPARFMRKLNRMLVGLTASHQFMSCVCGVFQISSRTFTYCNAGHPVPIHLSGTAINYLPSHGLLLGVEESIEYEQSTMQYAADDVFVFYSDGISEALSQSNRLFRHDGIAAAAQLHQEGTSAEIVQSIWDRMLAHQAGQAESDDATILAIKLGSKTPASLKRPHLLGPPRRSTEVLQ
ncbi:SpoIIE family protein phosphatase [bacterium]|nr:SpoIIE family protein phosphatase [bacterium]